MVQVLKQTEIGGVGVVNPCGDGDGDRLSHISRFDRTLSSGPAWAWASESEEKWPDVHTVPVHSMVDAAGVRAVRDVSRRGTNRRQRHAVSCHGIT